MTTTGTEVPSTSPQNEGSWKRFLTWIVPWLKGRTALGDSLLLERLSQDTARATRALVEAHAECAKMAAECAKIEAECAKLDAIPAREIMRTFATRLQETLRYQANVLTSGTCDVQRGDLHGLAPPEPEAQLLRLLFPNRIGASHEAVAQTTDPSEAADERFQELAIKEALDKISAIERFELEVLTVRRRQAEELPTSAEILAASRQLIESLNQYVRVDNASESKPKAPATTTDPTSNV